MSGANHAAVNEEKLSRSPVTIASLDREFAARYVPLGKSRPPGGDAPGWPHCKTAFFERQFAAVSLDTSVEGPPAAAGHELRAPFPSSAHRIAAAANLDRTS